MDTRCKPGFHTWETEPYGSMYQIRECNSCQRNEIRVKPNIPNYSHEWRKRRDGDLTHIRYMRAKHEELDKRLNEEKCPECNSLSNSHKIDWNTTQVTFHCENDHEWTIQHEALQPCKYLEKGQCMDPLSAISNQKVPGEYLEGCHFSEPRYCRKEAVKDPTCPRCGGECGFWGSGLNPPTLYCEACGWNEIDGTTAAERVTNLRKEKDYPCFGSSSVESCISARKSGEVNPKELRDGKPCPYFDECVELTETIRNPTVHEPEKKEIENK